MTTMGPWNADNDDDNDGSDMWTDDDNDGTDLVCVDSTSDGMEIFPTPIRLNPGIDCELDYDRDLDDDIQVRGL